MSDVSTRIDQLILPSRWAVVGGGATGLLSLLGVLLGASYVDDVRGTVVEQVIYAVVFGAMAGGIAAMAARILIKALRC